MKPSSILLVLSMQACAPAAFSPSPQAPSRAPAQATEPSAAEGVSAPQATSAARTAGAAPEAAAASDAPVTPESIGAKYRADVRKCMHGEPVDGGSMVGGGTCAALRRAARSGDTSELPKGAADAFKEERGR
jgi:hypothetical protein